MREVCRHCLEPLTKDEDGLCTSCRQSKLIGGIAIALFVIAILTILLR